MNPQEIQKLIEFLTQLEQKLKEVPGATEKFSTALNTLKSSLSSALKGEFLTDINKLNGAFKELIGVVNTPINKQLPLEQNLRALIPLLGQIGQAYQAVVNKGGVGRQPAAAGAVNAPQELPDAIVAVMGNSGGVKARRESAGAANEEARAILNSIKIKREEQRLEEQLAKTKRANIQVQEAAIKVQNAETAAAEKAIRASRKLEDVRGDKGGGGEEKAVQTLQDRIQALSDAGVSQEKFERAIEGTGISLQNEIKFNKDVNSGLTEFTTKVKTAEGVTHTLRGQLDGLGNVQLTSIGRFRQFGDQIARNITEVAKWSIAVGAVYGTLGKLNDLVKQAIDNQTKLAQIQIVLGDSSKNLNSVFKEALAIAKQTGTSVQGVLEAYTGAIRVTANISDETKRFDAANRLLADSLILAKLGTLDNTQAMDLLIASLNQTNQPLSEGQALLDKWVDTTNNAGVLLPDLATAFSVAGNAAQTAGIQVGGTTDQLSGLIAMLAEQFPYEGRELGNRVRYLVTSLQDATRQKELFNIGISPVDTEGQLRPFFEIIKELNNLYKEGRLSESQIAKIAGGDPRQASVLATTIKSLDRVQEIWNDTTESSGAAQDALGIQLETVDTAAKRLGNAFAGLAQSLGQEGGILEAITGITNLLTGLVDILSKLITVSGSAGTALATLLAGSAIYGKVFKVGGGLIGGISSAIGGQKKPDLLNSRLATAGIGQSVAASVINPLRGFFGGIAPGLIATGLTAALNENNRDISHIGAGIGGSIIGFLAGGPIGSVIGSQIGEGFVDFMSSTTNGEGVGQLIADSIVQSLKTEEFPNLVGDKDEPVLTRKEQIQKEIDDIVKNEISGLPEAFVTIFSKIVSTGRGIIQGAGGIVGQEWQKGQTTDVAEIERQQALITAMSIANSAGDTDTVRNLQLLLTELGNLNKEELQAQSNTQELGERLAELAPTNIKALRTELEGAFTEGTLGAKELFDSIERLNQIPMQLTGIMSAFGDEIDKNTESIEGEQETFDHLFDFLFRAPEEVGQRLQALSVREEGETLEQYNEKLRETIFLLQNTPKNSFLPTPELPQIVDLGDATQEQYAQATELSFIIADNLRQTLSFTLGVEVANQIMDGMRGSFLVRSGDTFAPVADGYSQFLQDALRQTQQSSQQKTNFGFQNIDMPSSSWGQIQNIINHFATQLGKVGYVQNKSPQVIKFSDKIIQVKDVDTQLLQLALNELIDVNRDQLEGIYNLPTDASFYVPFTGYKLGFGEGGGTGGGLPTVDLAGSDIFSSAVNGFSSAVSAFIQGTATSPLKINFEKDRTSKPLPLMVSKTNPFLDANGQPIQPGFGAYPQFNKQKSYPVPTQLEKYKAGGLGDTGQIPQLSANIAQLASQYANVASTLQTVRDEIPPLDLRIQMQAVLQTTLDGRLIAQVVKNFLAADLLKFQGSGGGATVRYVV